MLKLPQSRPRACRWLNEVNLTRWYLVPSAFVSIMQQKQAKHCDNTNKPLISLFCTQLGVQNGGQCVHVPCESSVQKFPTRYRWSAYLAPKSPKSGSKNYFFSFFKNKSQLQSNKVCYLPRDTSNPKFDGCIHIYYAPHTVPPYSADLSTPNKVYHG